MRSKKPGFQLRKEAEGISDDREGRLEVEVLKSYILTPYKDN